MCAPVPILAISTGISVIGGLSEASAQKSSGRFNRIAAQNAALVARQNAGRAGEVGRERVADLAEEGAQVKGRATTQLAANGVVIGDGSALDLTADIDTRTRRNISRTRQDTVRRQAGFIAQAGDLEQQGFLAEASGNNAARAALLNTGLRVAGGWYDYSKIRSDIE